MVSDVTPSVAHLRLCVSALALFASVSVLEVLGCSVSPCRSQWDFDGHVVFVPTTVLNESHSFFVLSQVTCCVHLFWLKISSCGEKRIALVVRWIARSGSNAVHLPCARSHSNASKLDAVLVDQFFPWCWVARREEERRGEEVREGKRRTEKKKGKKRSLVWPNLVLAKLGLAKLGNQTWPNLDLAKLGLARNETLTPSFLEHVQGMETATDAVHKARNEEDSGKQRPTRQQSGFPEAKAKDPDLTSKGRFSLLSTKMDLENLDHSRWKFAQWYSNKRAQQLKSMGQAQKTAVDSRRSRTV